MPRKKSKLARRQKYHYKKKQPDPISDHTCPKVLSSPSLYISTLDCFEETEEGWTAAIGNFIQSTEKDTSVETVTLDENHTDSDGFSGDGFLVILDKAYPYTPDDNLDELVHDLTASLRLRQFHKLSYSLKDCDNLFDFTLVKSKDSSYIKLCQFYEDGGSIFLKTTVSIDKACNAQISVHQHVISQAHDIWIGLPAFVTTVKDVTHLLAKLNRWNVCTGNYDHKFVNMVPLHVGISDKNTSYAAYREGDMGAFDGNTRYTSTVRSVRCQFLMPNNSRCQHCRIYRSTLRKCHFRQTHLESKPVDHHSKKPHSKMSKEELITKVGGLRDVSQQLESELRKLRRGVHTAIKCKGIRLNTIDNIELLNMLEKHQSEVEQSFPDENSLQRVFWEQQCKWTKLSNKSSMRWHPMIIKWCLYMKNKSSKAYDAMRNTGFVSLPSERTLFDYSHILSNKTGFHPDFAEHLLQEATAHGMFQESHLSYVGILQDEIKVSEGLVYDRTSGELVGFVDLDKTGNELLNIGHVLQDTKPKLATTILVVMIRGLSSNLKYPLACFATNGITADLLYPIIWETVEILEVDCMLKCLFVTCDGASPNRRFFDLHCTDDNFYWTWNPYATPRRKLYFISDVPHLIKTTRNCFANSYSHNRNRKLWKDGKDISWMHLVQLYEQYVENNLYSRAPKLTRLHIDLSAFSKMKVNLAAQVLSDTVANALEELYGDQVVETVRFIRHMNKFFDCMNTRNINEAVCKRQPNLKEYRQLNDCRFQYLLQDFLGYFSDWEESVGNRAGNFTKSQRHCMMLSTQTLKGLKISVNSIVESTKFLLAEGAKFVLTNRFNQDPLEEHFAHYRHKGGSNDNPSVFEVKNTLAQLRVIGSTALAPIHGNITRKRQSHGLVLDNTPLPKRQKR